MESYTDLWCVWDVDNERPARWANHDPLICETKKCAEEDLETLRCNVYVILNNSANLEVRRCILTVEEPEP